LAVLARAGLCQQKKGENSVGNEESEVFRGHLDECLRHLGARLAGVVPKGSRGAVESRRPLAEFCGVAVDSVGRWLSGTVPIGEQRLKLMCFLDLIGYRVIELERIPKIQRGFAELVGFGLVSSQEATELLGYSETSTMFKVLAGQQGASGDKNQRMWDYWKEAKGILERKKETLMPVDFLALLPQPDNNRSGLSELRELAKEFAELSNRLNAWLSHQGREGDYGR